MFQTQGCSALITGASAGIGEEFARQLAGRASALVLVARRAERLDALRGWLVSKHPQLRVITRVGDVTSTDDRIALVERLADEGVVPDLLVNNAGVGDYGEFVSGEWSKIDQLLQLNVVGLTHLTHLLLPAMIAKGGGAILNVSSLAGEFAIPDFAVYAASKAYVTSFSEGLRIETKGRGVHVVALCPGPVSTEFGGNARRGAYGGQVPGGRLLRADIAKVVSAGLRGAERNRPRVFPGFGVFLLATLAGALPKAAVRAIMSTRPKAAAAGSDAPQ